MGIYTLHSTFFKGLECLSIIYAYIIDTQKCIFSPFHSTVKCIQKKKKNDIA